MSNVLSSELYRLKKQKSTWILSIICVLFAVFNSCTLGVVFGNADWLKEVYSQILSTVISTEGYDSPLLSQLTLFMGLEAQTITEYLSALLTSDFLVIGAVFAVVFTAAPRRFGFLKNLATYHTRREYFLADALIGFCFLLFMVGITLGIGSLFSGVFFEELPFGNAAALAGLSFAALLAFYSSFMVMVMLIDGMKRVISAVLLIFAYLAIGSSLIMTMLDLLSAGLFQSSFSLRYFIPMGALSEMNVQEPLSWLITIIVSFMYLLVVFCVEYMWIEKRDID